jgi:hypothetical protein
MLVAVDVGVVPDVTIVNWYEFVGSTTAMVL